jgi:hypothetical protein
MVRAMLRDGGSMASSPAHALDLTIHAVELGVRYLNEYGNRDAVLMADLIDLFDQALRDVQAHALHDQFQQRCRMIMDLAAQSGLGWADDLLVCYESCFVD